MLRSCEFCIAELLLCMQCRLDAYLGMIAFLGNDKFSNMCAADRATKDRPRGRTGRTLQRAGRGAAMRASQSRMSERSREQQR